MYPLILRLTVHAGISGFTGTVYVRKEIDLPFVPYIGLRLSERGWHTELRDLVWSIDEHAFLSSVDLKQQMELLGLTLRDLKQETMDDLVEQLRRFGWRKE